LTLALCGLLVASSATFTWAQEGKGDKRRSPRATVRTFLTALTIARARPEIVAEAVGCLDTSALPGDQASAEVMATELEAVLRARDVDTERIPDKPQGDVYVVSEGDGGRIALRRMADGRWLFDRDTVGHIPQLYAAAQKHLQGRNKEAAALNVTPGFASARATVLTMVDGFRRRDIDRVLRCLDLTDIPAAARHEVGSHLAHKLRHIILRQPRIIIQEIPDSNYSEPYIWLSQPEGLIELVRVPAGERKGEWVFSRDTVRSIDPLYTAYEDKPATAEIVALGAPYQPHPLGEPELWLRSQVPDWLRTRLSSVAWMHLEVYRVVGFVLVPVLAFGVYRLTTWFLASSLLWILARRGYPLPRETFVRRLRPAGRLAGVLFLRWGALVLGPDRIVLVPLLIVLNPLVWILGMWAIFRVIDLISDLMEAHLTAEGRRPEIAQMLWPVGSLALKLLLFVVTLFELLALFSWDATAVLTGLGIGGLAFALGAQDALKNLFGSFTLLADRPFVVGEVVKIGNHELGTVEVVGLRSTRIRTGDDTLLVVPNSNLTTLDITNYGRRRYRRYLTRIGVAYSTPPDRLAAFRDGIQELVRRHDRTRKNRFEIAVHDLAASAVEILVNIYFEVGDRQEELAARDALILDILRLAEEMNIELAFPTQTIHLVPSGEPGEQSVVSATLAKSDNPTRLK
jgi:MscS family membrane protein